MLFVALLRATKPHIIMLYFSFYNGYNLFVFCLCAYFHRPHIDINIVVAPSLFQYSLIHKRERARENRVSQREKKENDRQFDCFCRILAAAAAFYTNSQNFNVFILFISGTACGTMHHSHDIPIYLTSIGLKKNVFWSKRVFWLSTPEVNICSSSSSSSIFSSFYIFFCYRTSILVVASWLLYFKINRRKQLCCRKQSFFSFLLLFFVCCNLFWYKQSKSKFNVVYN